MFIRIGNIEIQFDNATVENFFAKEVGSDFDFLALSSGDKEDNDIFIQHKDRKGIDCKLIAGDGELTYEISEKKK